jgi:serine/threonine protein kinase
VGAGADLDAGVLLGDRYRLDAVLGRGGMATVHRAHDVVLERDVAVKVFPPVAEGADEVQRHQAEMRVLARLNHPGLVTLHDAGSAPAGGLLHQTYLVMELVSGPTLAERLLRGPLGAPRTAHAGRQVAEALAVVHAAGVVHRDIKPGNILLTQADHGSGTDEVGGGVPGPTVKLADFGIARLSDGARLTLTGTTLGTASYLSPEQATGSALGPSSDVYSLGLVLLECLTGVRAFTGTMLEVAAARLTSPPPIPDTLGRGWTDLLHAMTARDPGDRPDAEAVALRLAALATEEPPAALVPVGTAPSPRDDGTAPLPPTVPLIVAEAAGAPPPAPTPREPATTPSRRPFAPPRARRRALLAVAALVLVVSGGAVLALQAEQAAPPEGPQYPVVEGPLGEALTDLQRSVEP